MSEDVLTRGREQTTHPGPGGTEEDLAVLPLGEVSEEVAARSNGSLSLGNDGLVVVGNVSTGRKEGIYVGGSLLDVALDIHGETRGL